MKSYTRLLLILLLVSLLSVVVAHQIWGRQGLVWSVVLALSANALLYFYCDRLILTRLPCRQIEGQDPWGLIELTRELAKRAGAPMPQIFVFPQSVPTACTIGQKPAWSAILLSEGLLKQFTKPELEAILAHELVKIQRRETRALTMTAALAGSLLALPLLLDRIFSGGQKNEQWSAKSIQPFTYLLAPLAGLLVQVVVNRRLYYESDRLAGALIGDPRQLAKALWKLDSCAQTYAVEIPATISHLFTVNPLTARGWNRYFHCQPAIDQRIRVLVGYFPI